MLVACSAQRPEQLTVDVFAEDTVPVRFTLTITGGLQMRVNAEKAFVRPDKSLVFETPTTLYVDRGDGASLLRALDSTQRLVVQPGGLPGDSAERAAVVAPVVSITRAKGSSELRFSPQPR